MRTSGSITVANAVTNASGGNITLGGGRNKLGDTLTIDAGVFRDQWQRGHQPLWWRFSNRQRRRTVSAKAPARFPPRRQNYTNALRGRSHPRRRDRQRTLISSTGAVSVTAPDDVSFGAAGAITSNGGNVTVTADASTSGSEPAGRCSWRTER